jgi:uncharacterized protein (DUF924 family)
MIADTEPLIAEILGFWFGPEEPQAGDTHREFWFRKDPQFDSQVRERYGAAISAALGGAYAHWRATPRGALALILLTDQFTRNAFRDTPMAFAGDTIALAAAKDLVASGNHLALPEPMRWFGYMPYQHSETLAEQNESVRLFVDLNKNGDFASATDYALKHREIVKRFGRFPHRNVVLRRASTPGELVFLQLPGSRF